ncbi:transmembrane protein, putative [Medicago truncatula]|uniref:Transmembrane protein, putative n=1 Tax=Medicago truncatula TaxID=3880 RepID=G7JHZ6_MEDTR|nr:transmembrane protein, putative [Medicago truncatula]
MVVKRVTSHAGAFPNVLSSGADVGTGKHVETSPTNSGVITVVGAAMTRTTAKTVLASFMTVLAKRRVRTDVLKLVRAVFYRTSFFIVPYSNAVFWSFPCVSRKQWM